MLIHVLVQEVASRLLEEIRLRGEKKKGMLFTCANFFAVDGCVTAWALVLLQREGEKVHPAWPSVSTMNLNVL